MVFTRKTNFRVLFISKTGRVDAPYLDPSARYRCCNSAEALRDCGVIADVISQDRVGAECVDNYDAFVFHRPDAANMMLSLFVKLARTKGKMVVADYDDLTFSPEFALKSSLFLNGRMPASKVRDIYWRNYKGFGLFDRFSVSTEPLAEHVRMLNPSAKVVVVPNGLSRRLVESCPAPANGSGLWSGGVKVLSYLSGTASHAPDIAYVGEVLADFLSRHRDSRLAVAGPAPLPACLADRPGVVRLPHREFFDFFPSAAGFYANIAPLSPGNEFNNCKSALKFFESGVWGVPTLASPIEDFKRFSDSRGLRMAETQEEWAAALESVSDAEIRCKMADGLREYCLEHCMADGPSRKLLSFLQEEQRT